MTHRSLRLWISHGRNLRRRGCLRRRIKEPLCVVHFGKHEAESIASSFQHVNLDHYHIINTLFIFPFNNEVSISIDVTDRQRQVGQSNIALHHSNIGVYFAGDVPILGRHTKLCGYLSLRIEIRDECKQVPFLCMHYQPSYKQLGIDLCPLHCNMKNNRNNGNQSLLPPVECLSPRLVSSRKLPSKYSQYQKLKEQQNKRSEQMRILSREAPDSDNHSDGSEDCSSSGKSIETDGSINAETEEAETYESMERERATQQLNSVIDTSYNYKTLALTVHSCQNYTHSTDVRRTGLMFISRMGDMEAQSESVVFMGHQALFETTVLFPYALSKSIQFLIADHDNESNVCNVLGIGRLSLSEVFSYHQNMKQATRTEQTTECQPENPFFSFPARLISYPIPLLSISGHYAGELIISLQLLEESLVPEDKFIRLTSMDGYESITP